MYSLKYLHHFDVFYKVDSSCKKTLVNFNIEKNAVAYDKWFFAT
jgi:hypothetical protein